MKVKYWLLILICLLSLIMLTGCYNISGIENKAYAIALGIDKSDTQQLKLSIQFAVLSGSDSSSSSSSSGSSSDEGSNTGEDKTSTILTVDSATLDSGIELINSYISKQVNLSHCKAIIISEEYASQGVSNILYTLMNNIELRPDCNIIISKCTANDFLKNSTPVFESNPAQYFTLNFNSSEYTGFLNNLYMSDFYYNTLSTSSDSSAILGAINSEESRIHSVLDDNYTAGQTPLISKNKVESMGTAVFRGDKFVGELNNLETLCHLIIENKLKTGIINIENPYDSNTVISFYTALNRKTKIKVKYEDKVPKIECEVWLTSNIPTIYNTINLSDPSCAETLNSSFTKHIETKILDYLNKTKDYGADIVGFGEHILPQFQTWQDWLDAEWLENYKNATFKVTVHSEIQGGYLYNSI